MRFDLESRTPTVTNVNDAGILAGGYNDALAGGWQPLQMNSRRLVRAMFRPHDRKNAQLDKRRLAAQQRLDASKLFGREVMSGDYFGSDLVHKEF